MTLVLALVLAAADPAAAYGEVDRAKLTAEDARARIATVVEALNDAGMPRSATVLLAALASDPQQSEGVRTAARAPPAARGGAGGSSTAEASSRCAARARSGAGSRGFRSGRRCRRWRRARGRGLGGARFGRRRRGGEGVPRGRGASRPARRRRRGRAARQGISAARAPRLPARRRRSGRAAVPARRPWRARMARRPVRGELGALPSRRGREGPGKPPHAARALLPGEVLPRVVHPEGLGPVRELPLRGRAHIARRVPAPLPAAPRRDRAGPRGT